MSKINDNQKRIYNSHLAISRKVKNLPFKQKQNFDNLDENKLIILNKLEKFSAEDPDSSESLMRFSNSLKFIFSFCKENNISLEEYRTYAIGTLPSFIEHLKNHKINYYTLHALTFSKIDVDSDILNFAFGDFWKTFQITRNKFQSSKKIKTFGKQAIDKINQNLKKQ
jgi:hypothetical protein